MCVHDCMLHVARRLSHVALASHVDQHAVASHVAHRIPMSHACCLYCAAYGVGMVFESIRMCRAHKHVRYDIDLPVAHIETIDSDCVVAGSS